MKTYLEGKRDRPRKTRVVTIRVTDKKLIEFLDWFISQDGANLSDLTRDLWGTSADHGKWIEATRASSPAESSLLERSEEGFIVQKMDMEN